MYGLLGEKLAHSFSKEIHDALGFYKYNLIEVKQEDLDCFLKDKKFMGINVTIPYKQKVIPYLDYVDENAEKINAVNTIVNKNNKLYGYNTDYMGLVNLIKHNNIEINNKKVIILGTGATSNTAYKVVKDLGAIDIKKVSRTKSLKYVNYGNLNEVKDFEILINTTPSGMYPNDDIKINLDKLDNLEWVIDVIYNPINSKLIREARKRNIKNVNGLYMLISQAVYSASLFLDKKIDNEVIDKIYQKLNLEKHNIVLIGMPDSGKSTIGKEIANKLNKEFVDTDCLIEKELNCKICDYLTKDNEDEFRKIESKVIDEISFSNNKIIATGGGVIKNKDNIDKLKRNGIVLFIDRPLSLLKPSSTRPLSKSLNDLEKLYNDRYPKYLEYADCIIKNDKTISDVIENIMEVIYENFSN